MLQNGDTALHIAAALKRRKIAKLLVEGGVDVAIKNKVGLLQVAGFKGFIQFIYKD